MDVERLDRLEEHVLSLLSHKIMLARTQLEHGGILPSTFTNHLMKIYATIDRMEMQPSNSFRKTHKLDNGDTCQYLAEEEDDPCPKHQTGTNCEYVINGGLTYGQVCDQPTDGYRLCVDHIDLVNEHEFMPVNP